MGLHWDPSADGASGATCDLDAVCMLFESDRILELVHPGKPRGAGGSVVHTGDSRTGASAWDDERVFVFLDALPPRVDKVAFVVRSVNGLPFDEVKGARCHISDRQTEVPWLCVDLTKLAGRTEHVVACLERSQRGWRMVFAESGPGSDPVRACGA